MRGANVFVTTDKVIHVMAGLTLWLTPPETGHNGPRRVSRIISPQWSGATTAEESEIFL
jgi:hypothetical protein